MSPGRRGAHDATYGFVETTVLQEIERGNPHGLVNGQEPRAGAQHHRRQDLVGQRRAHAVPREQSAPGDVVVPVDEVEPVGHVEDVRIGGAGPAQGVVKAGLPPSRGSSTRIAAAILVSHRRSFYDSVMSEAIAFDTHRFVKRLTDCGFTELQAETLADEHVALLNANLATKTDIDALRQATKADIAEVKADIDALRQATKADIDALRQATKADIDALRQATKADIAEVKADIDALRQTTKADIAEVKADIDALRQATKADIEALRQATKTDIAEVKADIDALRQTTKADIEALRQATKTDIAKVEARLEAVKVDLLKWLFGAMIAQGSLIVALVKLL